MNAVKMLTNKWVLVVGMAILITVAANASLADPPRHYGGDSYRGGYDGGRPGSFEPARGGDRGGYGQIDRDRGRDRGWDRGRDFGPSWRGGLEPMPFRGPMFNPPTCRPPVVCGGVRSPGVQVQMTGLRPGMSATVIVR